jgi:hypothetical protein
MVDGLVVAVVAVEAAAVVVAVHQVAAEPEGDNN